MLEFELEKERTADSEVRDKGTRWDGESGE
jgi:hypothetical protein